ncbi:MAG TPA: inositol monophosphatase [Firmicutes bacterium]|nr:inositol monophosphatase [Bacillota bacterium]
MIAAREAGAILKDRLDRIHSIEFKGERDLVTEADRLSEKCIRRIIMSKYPQDAILSEETATREEIGTFAGQRGRLWIVDPLDGTTNFAHGLRLFAVSIALMVDGDLVVGVVLDPSSGEVVSSEAGHGAYLGERRIRVSGTARLEDGLLATGFPYNLSRTRDNNLDHFVNLSFRCQAVRRLGSASLALTYVALGRLDGYWELGLSPWDVAAGSLIVTEAGGSVSDFRGGIFNPFGRQVVATNGLIHEEVLGALAEGRSGKALARFQPGPFFDQS